MSWENWMLDREKKSGHVVVDMMIHDIDFIQDVFGIPQDIKRRLLRHEEYDQLCVV